jgi:hypothetical protein
MSGSFQQFLNIGNTEIFGFGALSLSASSTLASTLTLGPNSAIWPTTPFQIFVINSSSSAGIIYVAPLGGVANTTSCIQIAPGGAYGFFRPSTNMTLIAASTATVNFQW